MLVMMLLTLTPLLDRPHTVSYVQAKGGLQTGMFVSTSVEVTYRHMGQITEMEKTEGKHRDVEEGATSML